MFKIKLDLLRHMRCHKKQSNITLGSHTGFVSNHGIFACVFEHLHQKLDGRWILHLAEAVGALVLEQSRRILEAFGDVGDGIRSTEILEREQRSISILHRLSLVDKHVA